MTAKEIKYTDEQSKAIFTHDSSVSLSAGAGCGKTFVLTERFISHLEPRGDDPHDSADNKTPSRAPLSRMIAITFTERAAREMRDRIRSKCKKRLLECSDEEASYWSELIRELDSARISTIHSFCGSLLRSHAAEAGLDPRFQLLEPAQADTTLFDIVDAELTSLLANHDEIVLELLAAFSLRELREMISCVLARRQYIDWDAWNGKSADDLTKVWEEFWRTETLSGGILPLQRSRVYKNLRAICLEKAGCQPPLQDMLAEIERLCDDWEREPLAAEFASAFHEAAKVTGPGKKSNWAAPEDYDAFKKTRDEFEKLLKMIPIRFNGSEARISAQTGLNLLRIVGNVAAAYDKKKRELGALDFDDLLIEAKKLLVGPQGKALRKRLASETRLLLVDEFQDTDPLQAELVRALCDGKIQDGKLFFVGDFKQSIYRFRGADPHVFRSLSDELPAKGRLPLSLNFRSQKGVLDFVNALFVRALGDSYEPLRASREQIAQRPAVEFLIATDEIPPEAMEDYSDESPDGGEDDDGPSVRLRKIEADWIARRIRGMLDGGEKIVFDRNASSSEKATEKSNALREVRPGDVAILFRTLTNVEFYEEALRRYGIDYYLVGGRAFYAQQEIYDLVSLLRAVDGTCDDVSLIGVLRSPFFNLDDETIFWLARAPGGVSESLFADAPPRNLSKEGQNQVRFASQTIGFLRANKDRMSAADLIDSALERTGFDALLVSEFMGERKLANLYKLIDQARSFDQSGAFRLADFITQLSQFIARQPDEPLAATQSESMNVVRLMTIHQAKGLEFPITVVADADRKRNLKGESAAFSPTLGPMVRGSDSVDGYKLYRRVQLDEDAAESVRLFYVAATRAADYLIISAGMSDVDAPKGPWMRLLGERFDLRTGSFKPFGSDDDVSTAVRKADDEYLALGLLAKATLERPALDGEPNDAGSRRDLRKIVEKALALAAEKKGRIPPHWAPLPADESARRHYSFSRLHGVFQRQFAHASVEIVDADHPSAASHDALGRGTLTHAVLAEINFADPVNVVEIANRLAPAHLKTPEADLPAVLEMLERFLASDRVKQLAAAKRIYRELEFLLAWPPEGTAETKKYVHGYIDCLYQDQDDAWRLLDFKTNAASSKNIEEIAKKYELQMALYSHAVEKTLAVAPAEACLCFLMSGLERQFSWTTAEKTAILNQCDMLMR